jgi:nitrite reductase (NADH) small subunit
MSIATICNIDDIVPNTGVCALVENEQVAVFRISSKAGDMLYAIANFDPFSQANVLARGIVGCKNGMVTVASPLYKQLFSLATGECLDDSTVKLKTWPVELQGNAVVIPHSHTQAA